MKVYIKWQLLLDPRLYNISYLSFYLFFDNSGKMWAICVFDILYNVSYSPV